MPYNFTLNPVVTLTTNTDLIPVGNATTPILWATPDQIVSTSLVSGNYHVQIGGAFGRGVPVTKTANFTLGATENWLINNKPSASCVMTLPSASLWVGREVMIQNWQGYTVVSASANIVPMSGGAAVTTILEALPGKRATLVSNGTNWQIVDSN